MPGGALLKAKFVHWISHEPLLLFPLLMDLLHLNLLLVRPLLLHFPALAFIILRLHPLALLLLVCQFLLVYLSLK